jgi:glycerol-3-phosphate dehydrogenase
MLPALSPAGLRGSHVNHDGQLEDDVRFVIALARTAESLGARIVTGAAATRIDGEGADVVVDGHPLRIDARAVVNAAGVWAGSLDPDVRLTPSKGAHLVVRAAALGHPTGAMAVAVPGEHNRYVFALPHPDGLVYLGLTDDALDGEPPEVVDASAVDADFLLATIGAHLRTPLTADDVVGSFAGLRPLIAGGAGSTADLSRRHAVTRSPDGAWTVVGGKLTTYRLMAQDAVEATGLTATPCRTTDLPLLGAPNRGATKGPAAQALPARLIRRYGSEAAQVAAAGPLEPVAAGVPVLRCELAWGVAAEGARTVEDLLARRTRLTFVREWAAAARPAAEDALATVAS